MDKKFICSICSNNFAQNKSLRQHVREKHPDERLDDIAPLKQLKRDKLFKCNECEKKFTTKKYLNVHQRSVHSAVPASSRPMLRTCPLCSTNLSNLIEHFEKEHDIKIEKEELAFSSHQDFLKWKKELEETTTSFFCFRRKEDLADGSTCSVYTCNRSGIFKKSGNGTRHLKTQGSRKIGGTCPAEIKCIVDVNDKCCVKLTKTHVGHLNELGHINLPKIDKENFAAKIASHVPFEHILNEVRDSISDGNLERKHLATRKDLLNIEAQYGLQSEAVRHANDAISIESWVKSMEKSGCILSYKPQGVEVEGFETNDFILAIMTDPQVEMAKIFASDCICVDGTHGLNPYGFELISVMVIDELRQGFPVAFLVSNRSDQKILTHFFECIVVRVGKLQPSTFMSDMAECFYNAWVEVMGTPPMRLYCTWHVDKAWRNNLKKISCQKKQEETYKILRTLLEERDIEAFNRMLQNVLKNFSEDPELFSFYTYFNTRYVKSVSSWAYCHRLHAGINTNMHLESMHKVIKHNYFNGKNVQRLDKAIHGIMLYVKDKVFDKIISHHKGKLTSKISAIRKRHKESLKMSRENVSKGETDWSVLSSDQKEFYSVKKICTNKCQCSLVCENCRACIHNYSCTCIDNTIQFNMCKHIHLVCMEENEKINESSNDEMESDDALHIHEEKDKADLILQSLKSMNPIKNNSTDNFEKKKKSFITEMNNIFNRIQNEEELNAVMKIVAPVDPTISALREQSSEFPNAPTVPANKNIEPQRYFQSTKKTRKQNKSSIVKPTKDDSETIAATLLLDN